MRRSAFPLLLVLVAVCSTAVTVAKPWHWHPSSWTPQLPPAAPSPPEAPGAVLDASDTLIASTLPPATVLSREALGSHRPHPPEASTWSVPAAPLQTSPGEPGGSTAPEGAPPPRGLPGAGMLCALDGGVLNCGACQSDSDCPAGAGCVANRETRRFECLPSECEEDPHCFPGHVCRPVTTGASGPVIRRCVPAGTRGEGEPCDGLFISPEGACQEGLSCHRGVCSRPCRLGDAAGCPEGYACEEGLNGPACFPDCRSRGCAGGQHCKQLNEVDYQCLAAVSGTCPETPCGEGERCNMRLSQSSGVFWCAALCNPLREDSCPAGQVCGIGGPTLSTCYRRCDPSRPESCGDGWQCTTVTEDMTQWGCRPSAP
jgi:hypothetical protein